MLFFLLMAMVVGFFAAIVGCAHGVMRLIRARQQRTIDREVALWERNQIQKIEE
jgi:hypothetical protein